MITNVPFPLVKRAEPFSSRSLYSDAENWIEDERIPIYHNRSKAPPHRQYTHSFKNGKGVIAVPEEKMTELLFHVQSDYNLPKPKKVDLIEEVHAVSNSETLLVNVFVRITPDSSDSWDEDFQLSVARIFAACLVSFGLDDRMFLYVSARHDPDDKSNTFSDVTIQSQICVTSSTLQQVWFYFQCLLQQRLPRKQSSTGWDQLVDLSACSDQVARLRMNHTYTHQPCPRCSDPLAREKAMFLCYWHKEFIPGEFRVIQVIDLLGIPCPHELRRLQASKMNEWLACSIRPVANPTVVAVRTTIPITCPPAPVIFGSLGRPNRKRKKGASQSVLSPGQPLFTHMEWLVRNHFPPHWRSIEIAELNWSAEEHYSLYAEGLGSHICMNPSGMTSSSSLHLHEEPNQVWFQILPQGWRQRCCCKQQDCKTYTSVLFPIPVHISLLLFPL